MTHDPLPGSAAERSPFPMSEAIARKFHEQYEQLARTFGYETRRESAVPWEQVPERNRRLMITVIYSLLAADVIEPGPEALR